MIHIEKHFTTKQIFDYFNVRSDSDIANSGQILGGIRVMKKNKNLIQMISLESKTLYDNALLFTDHYNGKGQAPYFRENRHEQSITSLLRKKMGSVVIDGDESWMPPFGKGESIKYPFWATRNKN